VDQGDCEQAGFAGDAARHWGHITAIDRFGHAGGRKRLWSIVYAPRHAEQQRQGDQAMTAMNLGHSACA
jgi:hypothetical protein